MLNLKKESQWSGWGYSADGDVAPDTDPLVLIQQGVFWTLTLLWQTFVEKASMFCIN